LEPIEERCSASGGKIGKGPEQRQQGRKGTFTRSLFEKGVWGGCPCRGEKKERPHKKKKKQELLLKGFLIIWNGEKNTMSGRGSTARVKRDPFGRRGEWFPAEEETAGTETARTHHPLP